MNLLRSKHEFVYQQGIHILNMILININKHAPITKQN